MSKKNNTLSFGKDKTAIIKGIAIIFMIIHHCGIPGYYDNSLPFFNDEFTIRCFKTFKLCVGIFTFMVGYGYAFSKTKDLYYSWTHIKKLLIPFWTILIVFTFPVAFYFNEIGDPFFVLLNLFGINSRLNWFSWFVSFFLYAMLVMPFLSKFINLKPIVGSLTFILLSYFAEASLHQLYPKYTENDFTQRLFDCLLCTPNMLLGYLFAQKKWFCKVIISNKSIGFCISIFLVSTVALLRFHFGAIMGFNLDFFYAPMFILAVLIIFNIFELSFFSRLFTLLGNTSVYMWFFHALFFTKAVRCFYQPFILISNNIWLIIPWTIILTFSCSWLIMMITNKIKYKLSNI